ncbi:MAG: IS5/IS1182 family transposase, partial [Opitutaceae bacterium]|nr:IS5/IS1182 family transposase [Opitutaceae bacterium]
MFGRRRLEPTADENVAGRLRGGDPHPDHDPIGSCRRQNRELLRRRFAPGLELAARGRVLQVGAITVA